MPNRPGIALKRSLLEFVLSVAARERKCSSRVIIGLVVEDIFCAEIAFGNGEVGKGRGEKRTDLNVGKSLGGIRCFYIRVIPNLGIK